MSSWLSTFFFWRKKEEPAIGAPEWLHRARISLLANLCSHKLAGIELRAVDGHGKIAVYLIDGSVQTFDTSLSTEPETFVRKKVAPWIQQQLQS